MLSRKHSLSRKEIFKNSDAFFSSAFILKIKKSDEELSRFAVVVSKRIDKRAVRRNKIRRWVKSSVEELVPSIRGSWQILIIAKNNARDKDFSQIKSELTELFKKINILG